MNNTEKGNVAIALFMGFPKVNVLSEWNYDRSLDNASNTQGLIVNNINEHGVSFKQDMPYKRYGLSYFDGYVFKPIGFTENSHAPFRKYHESWDWLMPVYRKIKDCLNKIDRPSNNHVCFGDGIEVDIHCAIQEVDILKAHNHIVEFIDWYNSQQK